MERLHKNEDDRLVYNLMSGFDLSDDRQHIPDVKFDMSPLYFAIAGSPDHNIRQATSSQIIEYLLAHPQIDPHCGLTTWDGKGNFTRTAPLMGAVLRVQETKKALQKSPSKDPRLVKEWQEACANAFALANHPRCNIRTGNHKRIVDRDGAIKDEITRPLVQLLQGDGLTLDCVLMLLLQGNYLFFFSRYVCFII
jgi:hypothetical protein